MENEKKGNSGIALGLAIAGLIVPFVGFVFIIIALIFAIKAKKINRKDDMATVAVVIAIIGLIFYVIILVLIGIVAIQTILETNSLLNQQDNETQDVNLNISIEILHINGDLEIKNLGESNITISRVSIDSCDDYNQGFIAPLSIKTFHLENCDLEKGIGRNISIVTDNGVFKGMTQVR